MLLKIKNTCMIGNVAKYPGNFEKESELRKDNT
jgi:hypothetical protein